MSFPEVNLNLIPGASDLTVLIKAVPIFKVSEVISPPLANSVPFSEKPADLITALNLSAFGVSPVNSVATGSLYPSGSGCSVKSTKVEISGTIPDIGNINILVFKSTYHLLSDPILCETPVITNPTLPLYLCGSISSVMVNASPIFNPAIPCIVRLISIGSNILVGSGFFFSLLLS